MKFETLYDKHGTIAVGFNVRTGRYETSDVPSFSDVRSDVVLACVRQRYPDMKLMNSGELEDLRAEQARLEAEERERLEAEADLKRVEEEAKVLEFAGVVAADSVVEEVK